MSRLTRDGTAEPVSRDQILRHVRGQDSIFIFPVQLTTSRIGNLTRLIHTLLLCDDHTYIHIFGGLSQKRNVYLRAMHIYMIRRYSLYMYPMYNHDILYPMYNHDILTFKYYTTVVCIVCWTYLVLLL